MSFQPCTTLPLPLPPPTPPPTSHLPTLCRPLTHNTCRVLPANDAQVSPEINHMLHLSVFPDDEFRKTTVFLVMMSIAGTFVWDRLVLLIFGAPLSQSDQISIQPSFACRNHSGIF